jgi:spore coat polysaccharide biosynthesis predicted glycosyltransferase SpsG
MRITIFIPALRSEERFQNDLLRKLDGISLIQRAINKAQVLSDLNSTVHVLTDSEEVALVASRNNVKFFFQPGLILNEFDLSSATKQYLLAAERGGKVCLVLSPYAPLLEPDVVRQALKVFAQGEASVLKPARVIFRRVFDWQKGNVPEKSVITRSEDREVESLAFTIYQPGLPAHDEKSRGSAKIFRMAEGAFEIETIRDWWVCEKLLQRKRIVFRVIGNQQVGTGHISRSLSLAHALTNHEALFVTDVDNDIVVRELIGSEYWTGAYPRAELIDRIIDLSPDLVIFDALDTDESTINRLKRNEIKVVSFEDLGKGSKFTNLTINELYDLPQAFGGNYLWGKEYFFVRDEFLDAQPREFETGVTRLLLTFGGVDQHDLSRRIYESIRPICKKLGIEVQIVTGPGYKGYKRLCDDLEEDPMVKITHATGVISGIMENASIAIASNGRTCYELAHMNIPSIIISQHAREGTHHFSSEENGFINLGQYQAGITEEKVDEALAELIGNDVLRRKMYEKLVPHNFSSTKAVVIKKIEAVLESPEL